MKSSRAILLIITAFFGSISGQDNPFVDLEFLIGNWSGTGSGFGNEKSRTEAEFKYIMEKKFIEVRNDSKFKPTSENPEGEHHIDRGFISYDESRDQIVYRHSILRVTSISTFWMQRYPMILHWYLKQRR